MRTAAAASHKEVKEAADRRGSPPWKSREEKKREDQFRKKEEEKMEAGYAAVVLYIQRGHSTDPLGVAIHVWFRRRLDLRTCKRWGWLLRMVMGATRTIAATEKRTFI